MAFASQARGLKVTILFALLLALLVAVGSTGFPTRALAESADEQTAEGGEATEAEQEAEGGEPAEGDEAATDEESEGEPANADEPTAGQTATTQPTATTGATPLEYNNIDELRDKKIGMLNGAVFDQLILKNFEGFSQKSFKYFNSNAEITGALLTEKVDAMITDLPIAQLTVNKNEGIGIMPDPLMEDHYGYVLEKDSDLTAQINERLAVYHDDGTIDRLTQKWLSADDSAKTMPDMDWDAPNGTLTVATSLDSEPMNYAVGDRPSGLCLELLELIARDLGYGIEYRTTNAGSLIAEVQSGKAEIAAASFSITDERKQQVDMTDPFYDGGVMVVVRTKGNTESDQGFFSGLANSFRRTFVEEDRWQLILSGLGVTLLISVVSGALGHVLGFVFVMLRRKKEGGLADKLVHLLESLLGGLPVVVILMVFYYVLFGSINIPGVIVAILVFTLLCGSSSGSIMWNAIRAVDVGQTEAGRALGFGDRDTFTLVVLPQAARQFVPLLLAQFVTLIKDTSIVGYIAVQDLTRVGDLIRSRTMEAFFPLIAIAVIYFAICRLVAWLVGLAAKRLEPKEGPRTIKGVEL